MMEVTTHFATIYELKNKPFNKDAWGPKAEWVK
jgi:hypothetical protein